MLLSSLPLMNSSACFFIPFHDHLPQDGTAMFSWVLLHQSLVKKFLQVFSEASMGGEAFS